MKLKQGANANTVSKACLYQTTSALIMYTGSSQRSLNANCHFADRPATEDPVWIPITENTICIYCIAFVNDLTMIGGVVEDYRQKYPADKVNKQLGSAVADGGTTKIGLGGDLSSEENTRLDGRLSRRGHQALPSLHPGVGRPRYWQCPQFLRRTRGR